MKIYNYNDKGLLVSESVANPDVAENNRREKLCRAEKAIIGKMKDLSEPEKANLLAKISEPEEAFLIPAKATAIKPPVTRVGEVAVFNGKKWGKVKDNRGQVFHFADNEKSFVMEELGPLPEGSVVGERPKTDEEKWLWVRSKRNSLLADSDWMVLPDSPLKDTISVMAYRQKLRDIPQDFTGPEKVVFPELV